MVVENLRGSGQKVSVGVRCRAGKAVVDLINQRRVASALAGQVSGASCRHTQPPLRALEDDGNTAPGHPNRWGPDRMEASARWSSWLLESLMPPCKIPRTEAQESTWK
ncbi:hypothetical protein VFPBJ_00735 [Purpureocillium lilacinum]|uniref:Uncharacterized protein n=1 Tax=Purpureocillium lilacinum TaxID=33203 RepID=A0A179H8V7_PURLI|nr:hypothetical protein VFPBJ_00735 [Purpureocillium lilacinum]